MGFGGPWPALARRSWGPGDPWQALARRSRGPGGPWPALARRSQGPGDPWQALARRSRGLGGPWPALVDSDNEDRAWMRMTMMHPGQRAGAFGIRTSLAMTGLMLQEEQTC